MKHTYFEPFAPNRITRLISYIDKLKLSGHTGKDKEWLFYLCKNCGYPRGEHYSPDCPGTISSAGRFNRLPNYPPEINVNLKLNINTKIL